MATISGFIEDCGGAAEVAKARGKPYSTVASWKARNAIPVEEWPGLLDLAQQRGVEGASYEHLVSLHTDHQVAS